jgi:hypothetical protein
MLLVNWDISPPPPHFNLAISTAAKKIYTNHATMKGSHRILGYLLNSTRALGTGMIRKSRHLKKIYGFGQQGLMFELQDCPRFYPTPATSLQADGN